MILNRAIADPMEGDPSYIKRLEDGEIKKPSNFKLGKIAYSIFKLVNINGQWPESFNYQHIKNMYDWEIRQRQSNIVKAEDLYSSDELDQYLIKVVELTKMILYNKMEETEIDQLCSIIIAFTKLDSDNKKIVAAICDFLAKRQESNEEKSK
jgi:hypothetical protein